MNSKFHGILVCSVLCMWQETGKLLIYFTHDNLRTFECIPCKTDAPRYTQPCPQPLPHYQSSTDTPAVRHLPLPTQKPRPICQLSPFYPHLLYIKCLGKGSLQFYNLCNLSLPINGTTVKHYRNTMSSMTHLGCTKLLM